MVITEVVPAVSGTAKELGSSCTGGYLKTECLNEAFGEMVWISYPLSPFTQSIQTCSSSMLRVAEHAT